MGTLFYVSENVQQLGALSVSAVQHGCSVRGVQIDHIKLVFFPLFLSLYLSLFMHTNTDAVMHNSRLCNIHAVFWGSRELSTNGAGPESSVWTQRVLEAHQMGLA